MEPRRPRIGLIGAGWRAETYLRTVAAVPSIGAFVRGLVRSESSADSLRTRWGLQATTSFEEFIAPGDLDFVFVCVPRDIAPDFTLRLTELDIPVLAETPLARDLERLLQFRTALGPAAKVQVAEQYRFQPHHAARLQVAHSGVLGTPTSAFVSVAHDYHGISLLRALLGTGFAPVGISAGSFEDPLIASLGPDGWAIGAAVTHSTRVTARFEFPDLDRSALLDFEYEQYFSPIRSRHIAVRGERGEIFDDDVRYLRGAADAVQLRLERRHTGADGDLEGSFLRGIVMGAASVYDNPFAPVRLSDDEIAIATVLTRMNEYVETGTEFYGLADASHDLYLSLLMHEAAASGATVSSEPQSWTHGRSVLLP